MDIYSKSLSARRPIVKLDFSDAEAFGNGLMFCCTWLGCIDAPDTMPAGGTHGAQSVVTGEQRTWQIHCSREESQ